MKKTLSLILAVVMILSVICLPVCAAETVKITVGSGKQFAGLLEAFDEVYEKQYENVTFEIYGKLTLENDGDSYSDPYPIGSSKLKEVHFIGKTNDAEIFVDDGLYNDNKAGNANGSTGLEARYAELVTFEKLIIDHNKNTDSPVVQASHRLNKFWYVNSKKNQIYADCTFKNIMLSDAQEAIFENCSFINDHDGSYSIFYRGGGRNSSLTLENCVFKAPRGLKLYTEGSGEQISEINVTGCSFMVVEKAAFEVESAVVYDADVVFEKNTFNFCKPVNSASAIRLTDEYITENNYFNKERPDSSLMYTGSEIKYYKGSDETAELTAGEITAKASVKNNWKVDLPVSIITAEYEVAENGIKTLIQTKRSTVTIAAGATEELSNTITISETNQRMVKTMVMPADFAYPITAVARLIPSADITSSYEGCATDENNVNVHVYRIDMAGFDYGDA